MTIHGYADADVRVSMGPGGARRLAGGRLAPVERAGRNLVRELQEPSLPPPDRISIGEAFRYARDNDHWLSGMRSVCELPRMYDPAGIAGEITL